MAAKRPAAPISAPTAAVATAAPPLDVDAAVPEPVPLVAAAVGVVDVLETIKVVLSPTETVYVMLPCVTVCRPSPRAGIEAGRGSSVTACSGTGWLVATAGMPVMTPLTSVWVRYCVLGFEGTGTELDWARATAAATARVKRLVKATILELMN